MRVDEWVQRIKEAHENKMAAMAESSKYYQEGYDDGYNDALDDILRILKEV